MKYIILTLFILQVQALSSEYKNYIKSIYQNAIPSLHIKSINLNTKNKSKFSNAKIVEMKIQRYALTKSKGRLMVIYQMPNKRERRAYYQYEIDATIKVLMSTISIARGEKINLSNIVPKTIKFKKLRSKPLSSSDIGKYESKRFIPSGKILLQNSIKKIQLIKAGDILNATIKDDGFEIEVSVIAKRNGSVGDVINVKNSNGKVIKAKILSKNDVEIL